MSGTWCGLKGMQRLRQRQRTVWRTGAELLRERGDVLDDGHAHAPLHVARQGLDGWEERVLEGVHAHHLTSQSGSESHEIVDS